MENIRLVVYAWIFSGKLPRLPLNAIEMVTLSIGRIEPDVGTVSEGSISTSENITANALLNWLDDRVSTIRTMLNRFLADVEPAVCGYALENALVYMFWRTFSVGATLDSVFDFCYLPPAWRGQTARLIGVFRTYAGEGLGSIPVDRQLTTRLTWRTEDVDDSMAWFSTGGVPGLRVPFLRPDVWIGPDLIFGLVLATGQEILVCVQSKSWSYRHSADTFKAEAYKLSPEGFYRSQQVHPRQSQVSLLISFRSWMTSAGRTSRTP